MPDTTVTADSPTSETSAVAPTVDDPSLSTQGTTDGETDRSAPDSGESGLSDTSGICVGGARIVAIDGHATITKFSEPLPGFPPYPIDIASTVDTAEIVTLCPGETESGCSLAEDGRLRWECDLPMCSGISWVSSGCSTMTEGDPYSMKVWGCCFEGEVPSDWKLTTSFCDAAREGMVCNQDAKCSVGHCRSSECVADEPRDCDDGAFCNGAEWCDPAVGCRSGFASAFDDNPCTRDSCDEAHDTTANVPVEQCADLCSESLEVTVADVTETYVWPWAVATIAREQVACGEQASHCRRTAKGEWFVANERGDALSAPVAVGCATYISAEPVVMAGTVHPLHTVRKCCVDQAPFVYGDFVGGSPIEVE